MMGRTEKENRDQEIEPAGVAMAVLTAPLSVVDKTSDVVASALSGADVAVSLSEVQDLRKIFCRVPAAAIVRELLKMEQDPCPVIHRFGPGVYMREATLPAGGVVLGHIHRQAHTNIFLKGRVLMMAPDGGCEELAAPMIFTGGPGRKIGLVLEEVVWLNVYATDETDVETLERMFLDKGAEWAAADQDRFDRAGLRLNDIASYQSVLTTLGITEQQVRAESENPKDQIPMPPGGYKFAVSRSNIQGLGVFATAEIAPGEIIGPARVDGCRTPLGRYTNHGAAPNAEMVPCGPDLYLRAIQDIPGMRGGWLGEEITTDYLATVKTKERMMQ